MQYDGDSNFSGSNSTVLTQTVNPIASQTGLQSSENPSIFADSVTFTATVSSSSSAPGIATPTGQVEFFDGSTLLATETLSGGTASYTTSILPVGANQPIEAKYLGDANYSPSNFTIQQTVNTPPLGDFWTGASAAKGGNDNWSNPGNWSLGAPPTSTETAYFASFESQYSSSNVDTAFAIANVTIDSTWGGSVTVSGPLTITGNLILASGTLGGNGAISVEGSDSQFSAGTLAAGSGGFTNGGIMTWAGGTLSGNVSNNGTLTISGSSVILNGTLTNSGTVDVTGAGTISVDPSDATINNQAGATFDFQADATLSNVYIGSGSDLCHTAVQQRRHAGQIGRLRHHHHRFPAQQHRGNAEQHQPWLAGALGGRDHRRLDHRERDGGHQ